MWHIGDKLEYICSKVICIILHNTHTDATDILAFRPFLPAAIEVVQRQLLWKRPLDGGQDSSSGRVVSTYGDQFGGFDRLIKVLFPHRSLEVSQHSKVGIKLLEGKAYQCRTPSLLRWGDPLRDNRSPRTLECRMGGGVGLGCIHPKLTGSCPH